eukprot:COSAG02_NODE_5238_length_4513_cov_5.055279_3_plen_69_part_00
MHWYDPRNPGTSSKRLAMCGRNKLNTILIFLDIIDPLTLLSDSEPELLRLLLLLTATTSPLRYHTKCI